MKTFLLIFCLLGLALQVWCHTRDTGKRWNEVKDERWDEPLGQVYYVSDHGEINDLNSDLQPGDVMVMTGGEWPDARINITASGLNEEGRRIYLVPEVFGEIILTGKVQVVFSGSNIEMRGLLIDGISDDKITPVWFEPTSSRCRFTNSVIHNFNRLFHDKSHHWVEAWGSYHTVDWNSFEEKVGTGQLVRLKMPNGPQLPPDTDPPSWGMTISHNYFAPREDTTDDNGEGIQIGLFESEWMLTETVMEFNYFYQYNGEMECISVKGTGNDVRYNTFEESACSISLRHGDANRVVENYVFCRDRPFCGGVRWYGDSHEVINNYIEGDNGQTDVIAGLALIGVSANSAYHRAATNTLVERNLVINGKDAILSNGWYNTSVEVQAADNIYIENILTAASEDDYIVREYANGQVNPIWIDNTAFGGIVDNLPDNGLEIRDPELEFDDDWGIFRPTASGLNFEMTYRPLTHDDVGPTWRDITPRD